MAALTLNSARGQAPTPALPSAFSTLKSLGSRVRPITTAEFGERLQLAQQLMSGAQSPAAQTAEAAHYDALFLAPGSSLYYFTGIRWGLSERLLGLVIPRTGNPIIVVPAFEEGRLREKLHFPFEVRAWQEDESPTKLAAEPSRTAAFAPDESALKKPSASPSLTTCGMRRQTSSTSPLIRLPSPAAPISPLTNSN